MKKKTLAMLLMLMPLAAMAQSNWEIPETKKSDVKVSKKVEKANETKEADKAYLAGAVPEEDGKVVFSSEISTGSMSAQEAFDIAYKKIEQLTGEKNQTQKSRISLINKDEHSIVAAFGEWLVFTNHAFVLDRTLFNYLMVVNCSDGKVNVKISRLAYEYSNGHDGTDLFYAEDLITDKLMLAKNGKKLKRINRKFRVATVDRMREVLNSLQQAFSESTI